MSKAYPVRRRARAAGRLDRRRRRALPSLRRIGRAQARHGRRTASIAPRRPRFSSSITSPTRPIAARCWARPLCSGGCYHEAHTRYGDDDAAEPALLRLDPRLDRHLPARSTASWPSAIRSFSTQFDDETRRSERLLLSAIDLKADQPQGAPRRAARPEQATSSRCSRARRNSRSRIFRSAARWSSRRAGKPIGPAAPPACASRSSATSSTATSAASGRRRCRTSSITRPTGPASARRRRRTGARSISFSRAEPGAFRLRV